MCWLAILADETLSRAVRGASAEMEKISIEALRKNFFEITAQSAENEKMAEGAAAQGPAAPRSPGGKRAGEIHDRPGPRGHARARSILVLCRETEIRQVITISSRGGGRTIQS